MKNLSFVLVTAILLAGCSIAPKGAFKEGKIEQKSTEPTQQEVIDVQPEQKYSVQVKSASQVQDESPHDVTYQLKINNISIQPYITNFSFNECQFIDGKGVEYPGQMMTETVLDKAILPGASQEITIRGQVDVTGYGGSSYGFSTCGYQQDGSKQCSPLLSNVHIKNCKAYVTSDGKQASNGWGNNPILVEFPTLLKR